MVGKGLPASQGHSPPLLDGISKLRPERGCPHWDCFISGLHCGKLFVGQDCSNTGLSSRVGMGTLARSPWWRMSCTSKASCPFRCGSSQASLEGSSIKTSSSRSEGPQEGAASSTCPSIFLSFSQVKFKMVAFVDPGNAGTKCDL